jgi:hypothetical protein
VSFNGRPNLTPLACARLRPSSVLARIRCRSNVAKPARIVIISSPCGVVVSAQASARDLNLAPAFDTASKMLSRSRVDLAKRSRRVTSRTSPGPRAAIAFVKALSDKEAIQRAAVFEDDLVRQSVVFARRDLRLIVWMLAAMLIMLGIIADRMHLRRAGQRVCANYVKNSRVWAFLRAHFC